MNLCIKKRQKISTEGLKNHSNHFRIYGNQNQKRIKVCSRAVGQKRLKSFFINKSANINHKFKSISSKYQADWFQEWWDSHLVFTRNKSFHSIKINYLIILISDLLTQPNFKLPVQGFVTGITIFFRVKVKFNVEFGIWT